MKWLILIPTLVFGASHSKKIIKDQLIVKGASLIQGKVLRRLGPDLYLVKNTKKIKVDNKNFFYNYEYRGEFKEAITKKTTVLSDPLFKDQTHLPQIKAPEAWRITQGSSEIIIAVTDNEFELDHDDLKHAWWKNKNEIPGNSIDDDQNGYIDDVIGWDFVTQDSNVDVEDAPTHGTHVSGIIAAQTNNSLGVAGIAPKVKVMPLRWYGDERRWETALVVETYHYAIRMGAKIINTSYNIDPLVEDPAYLDVIQYAKKNDVLIFNSAGNDNKKDPPRGVLKDIVLVCSVKGKKERKQDIKSRFSNYGKEIDLCAPGDPILSTVQRRYLGESRYGELEGTSMSSPVAASVAALIWSHNPNFSRDEVLKKLLESTDNIDAKNKSKYHGQLGSGRVNALKALK
jgi:thermitase